MRHILTIMDAVMVIDLEAVRRRLDNDLDLWLELVKIFLSTSEESLLTVKALIAQQNFTAAQQEFHTLKGALSNLGATQATSLAKELEYAARAQDNQTLTTTLPLFEAAIKEIPVACAALGYPV